LENTEHQKLIEEQKKVLMQQEFDGKQKAAEIEANKKVLMQQEIERQQQEVALLSKQKEIEEQERIKQQQQLELERQRQELENQKRIEMLLELENEKKSILANYAWSPFIMGLTDGELAFYVQPLPSYTSKDVIDNVETLASWMDGKIMYGGIKLKRVYQQGIDDFSINWVKDYQEEAIGRQVGDYLIVGLGMNNCFGEWRPFTGYTVYKIMWHEIGHALGYDHVSDSNNILYEGGSGTKFDIEYEKSITLADGYYQVIPFCKGGSYFFTTNTNDQYNGYKVYVVPPNTDPEEIISGNEPYYLSCSAYENEMTSFSQSCNVDSGSYLLIYNPTALGLGSGINVNIKTYDRNPDHRPNLDLDESHMYFTQDFIDHVWDLFHTQSAMP
ncbi:MAG: hypothetical protein WD154_03695, partial [Nitrosopumilaceae archaeon]